jgi:NAD(P)-dependent dehydrogenase (short-subunit alcohol dehydrogenase family)
MWTLDGKVALVTGGGKGVGRATALTLAARGVRLIVTGREERALGETVGEIAHGGGKARHLAGDVRDRAHVEAAVARALDVFGGLDLVIAGASSAAAPVATDLVGALHAFESAIPRMKGPGRLVALLRPEGQRELSQVAADAGLRALCDALATQLVPRAIACSTFLVDDAEPFVVARRLVGVCAS